MLYTFRKTKDRDMERERERGGGREVGEGWIMREVKNSALPFWVALSTLMPFHWLLAFLAHPWSL